MGILETATRWTDRLGAKLMGANQEARANIILKRCGHNLNRKDLEIVAAFACLYQDVERGATFTGLVQALHNIDLVTKEGDVAGVALALDAAADVSSLSGPDFAMVSLRAMPHLKMLPFRMGLDDLLGSMIALSDSGMKGAVLAEGLCRSVDMALAVGMDAVTV